MIILINGTSSSGKSSVCAEVHSYLGAGWLLFSTDNYLTMLGETFLNLHPHNPNVTVPNQVCYAIQHKDGSYEIAPDPYCSKLYNTIPDVLSLLIAQGFSIVVDAFILTNQELAAYKAACSMTESLFVYLYADEKVIEAREANRGDRLPGSSLHWLRLFECADACDMAIDTSNLTVEDVCAAITSNILPY
jgi:chloramphenicol 3-O-phosphotransferase